MRCRASGVTRHNGFFLHAFRTPGITRPNSLLPPTFRPRSRAPRVTRHNNLFLREFELMLRGVEDFLAMPAAHAAVVRREQVRVEAEDGFAEGTAGCQEP